jgi:hypothetical protein
MAAVGKTFAASAQKVLHCVGDALTQHPSQALRKWATNCAQHPSAWQGTFYCSVPGDQESIGIQQKNLQLPIPERK